MCCISVDSRDSCGGLVSSEERGGDVVCGEILGRRILYAVYSVSMVLLLLRVMCHLVVCI